MVDSNSLQQIYDQICYYFSDANMRKDKFLKEKIAEDADRWVPISVLFTFNRLKTLAGTADKVAEAVAQFASNDDCPVELSEEKDKIRRKAAFTELSEEELKALNERTVHLKGFPQDASLDDIIKFCQQFGSLESVEMRRFREDKKFKGCIMAIYSTKEDAQKAVESTQVYDPEIKFQRETKVDYIKRKAEYMAQKNARKNKKATGQSGDDPNNAKDNEDDQNPVKVKSCVLLVSDLPNDLSFAVIKETMKHHGSVQYVDINTESKTATIRFSKENEAISVLKTASQNNGAVEDNCKNGDKTNGQEDAKTKSTNVTDANKTDENSAATAKEGEEAKSTSSAPAEEATSTNDEVKVKSENADETKENISDKVPLEGDILINEKSYHAKVLCGEEEEKYWRALNEFRKTNVQNSNRSYNHWGKKGRGFKRGGGGYKGNREGIKRSAENPLVGNSAKQAKTE